MKHACLLFTALLLPALASAQVTKPVALGCVTGRLIYPSEYFPPDMKVTAVPVSGKGRSYSTSKNQGYSLNLPAGDYYVYAATKDLADYKAYYTKFVTCGLRYGCPSHAKIVVHVKAGITLTKIDPQDWYEPARQLAADSVNH